jgi:hypothetical protein
MLLERVFLKNINNLVGGGMENGGEEIMSEIVMMTGISRCVTMISTSI